MSAVSAKLSELAVAELGDPASGSPDARNPDGSPVTPAASYIRGATGSAQLSGRRVAGVVLAVTAACLAVITAVLAVQGARENTVSDRLRHHGVPVPFTVTSCLGLASGTGITSAGFSCQGTFPLAGHSYRATLGGDSNLHQPGDVLAALADPAHPTTVSVAAAVRSGPSYRALLPAMVAGACLVALLLCAAIVRRRRRAAAPGRGG